MSKILEWKSIPIPFPYKIHLVFNHLQAILTFNLRKVFFLFSVSFSSLSERLERSNDSTLY